MVKAMPFLAVFFSLIACGQDDDSAYLALKVISTPYEDGALRRFPPNLPEPLNISVRVYRSDNLLGSPVVDINEAWEELEVDPESEKKYLLIPVKSNAGKNYNYLLRLASIVDDNQGGLVIDECGVIGHIVASRGAKASLQLATHYGDCSKLICEKDGDCVGENRYCLSFECQDRQACGNCPTGAYCDEFGWCAGSCDIDEDCNDGFVCCQGMCSAHCPS